DHEARALRAGVHRRRQPAAAPRRLPGHAQRARRSGSTRRRRRLLHDTAAGVPSEFVEQMRQEPFWRAFEAVAHTLAYDASAAAAGSGSATPLRQGAPLQAPTLVIDGGESHPYQHTADEQLAATLPHRERQTLAGESHEVAPDVLAPALTEFLTRTDGAVAT